MCTAVRIRRGRYFVPPAFHTPPPPLQQGWKFLVGEQRFCKTKQFKEMCEAQLKFPEAEILTSQNPSIGEL